MAVTSPNSFPKTIVSPYTTPVIEHHHPVHGSGVNVGEVFGVVATELEVAGAVVGVAEVLIRVHPDRHSNNTMDPSIPSISFRRFITHSFLNQA